MMRRLLLAAVVVLLCGSTACGTDEPGNVEMAGQQNEAESTTASVPHIKAVFIEDLVEPRRAAVAGLALPVPAVGRAAADTGVTVAGEEPRS